MKLNEFWVQLFGSDDSNKEFEQLNKWKSDGELNAHKLQEMVALNKESSQLQSYKAFDMEAALAASMSTIDSETVADEPKTKSSFPSYVYWLVGLLILTIAGISYSVFSNSSKTDIQYASNDQIYSKKDGSEFVIKSGSMLETDEGANHYSLQGEAYFDVEKQEKPLTIDTKHGTIKVLGTSFNVLTSEDLTEIFMFSGVIEFTDLSGSTTKVSKGQYMLTEDSATKVLSDKSSQLFSYWRTETLEYQDADLSNVLDDLNRLYSQNMNSSAKAYQGIRITANFKNSNFEEIISELEVITRLELK